MKVLLSLRTICRSRRASFCYLNYQHQVCTRYLLADSLLFCELSSFQIVNRRIYVILPSNLLYRIHIMQYEVKYLFNGIRGTYYVTFKGDNFYR
jgi:hypothetical protein